MVDEKLNSIEKLEEALKLQKQMENEEEYFLEKYEETFENLDMKPCRKKRKTTPGHKFQYVPSKVFLYINENKQIYPEKSQNQKKPKTKSFVTRGSLPYIEKRNIPVEELLLNKFKMTK